MAELLSSKGPFCISKNATRSPQFSIYSEADNSGGDLAIVIFTGDNAETEANAKLLAAAPLMIEALLAVADNTKIMAQLQRVVDDEGNHICGNIRDAIAQAVQ